MAASTSPVSSAARTGNECAPAPSMAPGAVSLGRMRKYVGGAAAAWTSRAAPIMRPMVLPDMGAPLELGAWLEARAFLLLDAYT